MVICFLISALILTSCGIIMFSLNSNKTKNKEFNENDYINAVPKTTLEVIAENAQKIVASQPENHGIFRVSLFVDDETLVRGYCVWTVHKTMFFDLNHNILASFDNVEESCLSDWTPNSFKIYDQLSYHYMFNNLWAQEHKNVKTGWSTHTLFRDGEISHLWEENIKDPDLRYHIDHKTNKVIKLSKTDSETGQRAYYDLDGNFIELCAKNDE